MPQESEEPQLASISRDGEFIGSVEIEEGKSEVLVDAESIESRLAEPFERFHSGEHYLISIGTRNRPRPPDTDESLKPANHLYVVVE